MENSQRQIFEQQISLLRSQIEEQDKRQDKLRSLIDTLTQQIQDQRELEEQNYRLDELNSKLLEGLREAKNRHSEEIKYYDSEISRLKEEIHGKITELEKCRLENQRKQLVYEQKIAMVESIIEKKCHRVSELERRLHQESILKLKQSSAVVSASRHERGERTQRMSEMGNSVLRVSQISNCFDNENNMRASNLSTVSKMSTRMTDYMKMSKSEIKSLMTAVLKSKKEMEKATEQGRETGTQKFNKTTLG